MNDSIIQRQHLMNHTGTRYPPTFKIDPPVGGVFVHDNGEESSVSSTESYFSEIYDESSGGDYESSEGSSEDDNDLYEGSNDEDSEFDSDSDSTNRSASTDNSKKIGCNLPSSFEVSIRSSSSGFASVLSTNVDESPITIILRARQGQMSRERIAPKRSRSMEETPRKTLMLPRAGGGRLDGSTRSHEFPRTGSLAPIPLCQPNFLKRVDKGDPLGGPRDGGKSFFLNMMTASSHQHDSSVLPSIDLNKSIGLSGIPRRGRSISCDIVSGADNEIEGLGLLDSATNDTVQGRSRPGSSCGGSFCSLDGSIASLDVRLNRKWRECLNRSRNLRSVG